VAAGPVGMPGWKKAGVDVNLCPGNVVALYSHKYAQTKTASDLLEKEKRDRPIPEREVGIALSNLVM
jgi:hypothetical protein